MIRASARGSSAGLDPAAILWAGVAILLPTLLVTLAPLSTIDLGYGLRAGGLLLDGRGIQVVDTFTFTAGGQSWINQQWLGQVLFAATYSVAGWPGLAALWAILVMAIQATLWLAARWSGAAARWTGMALLGGFLVAAQGIGLRAQVLGLLCLAAMLAATAARRRHPPALWLAVPIVAAWANLHGSFPLGVVLLGLTAAEDVAAARHRTGAGMDPTTAHRRRTALAVLAAGTAVTVANPFGLDAWRYVGVVGTDATIARFVTEWQRTSPFTPAGAAFYASVVVVAALTVVATRRGRRPSLTTLAWLAGLAFLGAWAIRAVAFWGVGVVPAAAVMLTAVDEERTASRSARPGARGRSSHDAGRALPVALVCVLAIVAVAAQPLWRPAPDGEGLGARLTDAPRGIADAVDAAAAASGRDDLRVFNAQRWGSWLELATPQVHLFADSRIELIPTDAWRDYVRISEGDPAWTELLDRRSVDLLVVSERDQPTLAALVREDPRWRVTYAGDGGVVAMREPR